MSLLLSVIVPVYNERHTLAEVIQRLEELTCEKEILIIDDGSTDGTSELVARLASSGTVRAYIHTRNLGKGASVRTGLAHSKGKIIVVQDADLEYHPVQLDKVLKPIREGEADVVYGTRFGPGSTACCSPTCRIANGFLTWLSNRLTGLKLTDVHTCYKAMRREVIDGLTLREHRFGFDSEVTAKIARGNWRLAEVPIQYVSRTYAAGKKIGPRDGFRAIWCTLRYSLWC